MPLPKRAAARETPPPSPPPPSPPPSAATSPAQSSCPAVYVYNATRLDVGQLKLQSFGEHLSDADGLYNSNQHGLGALMFARLLRSKRCRPVTDPREAELFIVPLLIPPRRAESSLRVETFMAASMQESFWHVCKRMYEEDWFATLPHLTPTNAARHVFIPDDILELTDTCLGIDPAYPLYVARQPARAALLAMTPKLISNPHGQDGKASHSEYGVAASQQRIFAAPLLSSVHVRLGGAQPPPPWAVRPAGSRPYLMSYGGSAQGSRAAVALRTLLIRKCAEYGNTTCRLVSKYKMDEGTATLLDAFASKRESVFCLEPPGFGEHRKSMTDALTLGCIPVMFSVDDSGLWERHWGPFRDDSRIRLDPQDVLAGRVDVLEALRAVPAARVAAMQRAIADNAHRVHYGLEDTAGDALEILLAALARSAGSAPLVAPVCRDAMRAGEQAAGLPYMVHRALPPQLAALLEAAAAPCVTLIAKLGCDGAIAPKRTAALARDICPRSCKACDAHPAALSRASLARPDSARAAAVHTLPEAEHAARPTPSTPSPSTSVQSVAASSAAASKSCALYGVGCK